jgi:hypothetical protein
MFECDPPSFCLGRLAELCRAIRMFKCAPSTSRLPQLRDALTRGCLIFDSWERIGDRANDASRVAGGDRVGGDIFCENRGEQLVKRISLSGYSKRLA